MTTLDDLKVRISKTPRIKLANLPTPLHELRRLSKVLGGPRLWIKREDCTCLAPGGGNKERKTEFVMADALKKGADVVVTTGAVQSNHARATAAAARRLGLKVVLVLEGKEPKEYDGNLLLDHLMGADIRFVSAKWSEIDSILNDTAKRLKEERHVPYVIPGGASYPIGAIAYVNAMLELIEQAKDAKINIDCLIHASASGGTQAGLVLGNKTLKAGIEILGICAEPNNNWLTNKTVEIGNEAAKLLGLKEIVDPKDVTLINDYAGEAYGVLTKEATETINLVAQTEGILLDPVYTSKAMAGLIDMIKKKRFNKTENVVFIHTGGTPALFAYKNKLRTPA